MNDAQFYAYSHYLHTLADRLLLRDWEVEFLRDWAEDGTYAQAFVFHQENHLRIKVKEGFLGHTREQIREWLIHELLHAHLARTNRITAHYVELRDDEAARLFKEEHNDESEVVVQRFARILAPFMPLPPDVEGANP